MSSLISSAFQYVFGKEKKYILMLGLNNAGKTTILNGLKLAEVVSSTPSIGFNVEKMKSKNRNIVSWDLGNKDKQHPLWRSYCQNTENLIFVVDSSDHERIDKAREELQQLLSEATLKDVHLLIYANKKDLSNAMNVAEITDKLDLHSLNNRQWYVQVTCATSGDGLFDGLDWLSKQSKNIK